MITFQHGYDHLICPDCTAGFCLRPVSKADAEGLELLFAPLLLQNLTPFKSYSVPKCSTVIEL
jgi:hypothetical protein